MDPNSRKRKIESDEFNDEDLTAEKSMALKSLCSPEVDIKQTYGLKQEFLNSLGITVPFDKWIYVTNFRCDKAELKEILELAGHVITCALFARNGKRAKVMYSHPLEAVQAVSMLHGQTFYGQKLNVTMLPCPGDTLILPKGLSNVGPGLGLCGRPLRDVVKHYSKYLKHKVSLIDQSLFHNSDDIKEENQRLEEQLKSENEAKDSDGKHSLSYDSPFKIANVEDLPDDVSTTSESKTKKTKRDSDASDEESEDGKSNASSEEPKTINTIMSRREIGSKTATNPAPNPRQEIPSPQFTPALQRPQNYRPMHYTNGPQMVPNPVMMGPCPQSTIIGSLAQGPAGPYGVPIRPTRPAVGPIGTSLRSIGPPVGPIGAAVAPIGHPAGPVGPTARLPAPIGPVTRPPGTIGPTVRVSAPFPPQVRAGPFQPSGTMPNSNLGPRPLVDAASTGPQITLQFINLPPTTTFPLLCEKVAQCGQVLSLQLTTPGCAVARFAHKAHADRCFQFFNGKFIDGHVIEVRYA